MLFTIVAVLKREELQRLLAVQSLFSEDKITANLSDMGGAFLTVPASRGDGPVSEFPDGTPRTLPANLGNFIGDRRVTALLVMKGGTVMTKVLAPLIYASVGLMQDEQIVPADWIATSAAPTANTAPGETG